MKKTKITFEEIGVKAEIAAFAPQDKVAEFHVMLHVDPRDELFAGQLERIYKAERLIMEQEDIKGSTVVMKRYFLSDSANQAPLMKYEKDSSVSIIQQAPLDGSKVAVWLYLQKGTKVYNEDGVIVAEHNGYRHLWKMGMHEHKGDSAWQTESLLISYAEMLQNYGATLADNCIRTWFFVRDVDTQYAGMVTARKDFFREQGLTEKTHYISSTGIGGSPADTKALLQLGTYALTGMKPSQQQYLYAPTHLNLTYEYGVTFERGTLVKYGDRGQIFISGTASIDNKGNVLYVGDIVNQTRRMWENVEKLLEEGGATFNDVMQIVVYLRDSADYLTVSRMFKEKFPDTPYVITLAPVCRPAWLIEMECIAVTPNAYQEYKEF